MGVDFQNDVLRIEVFGGLRLIGDKGSFDVSRQQTGSLLALLALQPGRRHLRDELSSVLWPDDPEDESRPKLRQRLLALRQLLDRASSSASRALIAERDTVELQAGSVSTDLAEFDALIAEARESNPSDRLALLKKAAGLYKGPLLQGFYLEPVLAAQDSAQERYRRLLLELSERCEEAGDYEAASGYGRKLVAIDPYSEEGHCGLMRVHAACGRPADVTRQFEALAKALREIGTTPLASTVTLAESLRAEASRRIKGQVGDIPPSMAPPNRPAVRKRLTLFAVAAIGAIAVAGISFNPFRASAKPDEVAAKAIRIAAGDMAPSQFHTRTQQAYGVGNVGVVFKDGALRLLDGYTGVASSAWFHQRVPLRGFEARFRFRIENPPGNPGALADGFCFVIQNWGVEALGTGGSGLGYSAIASSFALKFGLFGVTMRHDAHVRTWGFFGGGSLPVGGSVCPFDFANGDLHEALIRFDGDRKVSARLTNLRTRETAQIEESHPVLKWVETDDGHAWIGFTGGTGMGWCRVEIVSLDYRPI